MFKALWLYRGFVFSSIRNEFSSRFARSSLGGLWMIINPLLQVMIFALILSRLLAAKLPGVASENAYALYLMAGTLAWSLFSEIVTRCMTLFIERGDVMKKIQFPRITLPTIVVGSCLFNNALLFLSIILIFSVLDHPPTYQLLLIPVLSVIVASMALGVGLILGVFNVFLRDLTHVIPVLLQILYWFTPIVYPASVIPQAYKELLQYNPLAVLVGAYQNVLVYGAALDWFPLMKIMFLSFMLLGLGLFIFRKASAEIVDVL